MKEELSYSGMLVKELAARSGVNKRTIDNYLDTHTCMPSADAAVRIARVLGVSVERLVTGNDSPHGKTVGLDPDFRNLLRDFNQLDARDRQVVLDLIKALKERKK